MWTGHKRGVPGISDGDRLGSRDATTRDEQYSASITDSDEAEEPCGGGRLSSLVELFRLAFDPIETFVRVTNLTGEVQRHRPLAAGVEQHEAAVLGKHLRTPFRVDAEQVGPNVTLMRS